MGLFTKTTKTSFERNKKGKVVKVVETKSKPLISFKRRSKTPVYDKLKKQYYREHPEETITYKTKSAGKKLVDAVDTWADNYAKSQGVKKKRSGGSRSRSSSQYVIRGGKAYPVARQPKKKTVQRRTNPYSPIDFTNNFNPIGDMFDSGIPVKKRKKDKGFDSFDNYGFF